jgi:hypothetical protein
LIRSELCALVGMSVAEFNTALSVGDLPFEAHLSGEMRDEQGRVRSNFTLDHATLLLAMRQLVSGGLSWSEAAVILREPRVPIHRTSGTAGGSYCVARAEFMREGGGEPRMAPRFIIYGGPLPDIVAAADAEVKAYNRHHAHTAYEKIALTSLVATDLTRARRVASARAEELGLAPQQTLRIDPDADVSGLESNNLHRLTPSRTGRA